MALNILLEAESLQASSQPRDRFSLTNVEGKKSLGFVVLKDLAFFLFSFALQPFQKPNIFFNYI